MHCALFSFVLAAGCNADCQAPGLEGSECEESKNCRGELACTDGTCQIKAELFQDMAKQSGSVVASEQVASEPEVAGTNTLGAVRVRSAKAQEYAFALCSADERLVSGWCDPVSVGSDNTEGVDQKIAGHTESDTIGARWVCSFSDAIVTANALCQKVR
jgi:hypothetical protein